MASEKLARQAFYILSRLPVRRAAAVRGGDAGQVACALRSQPKARTMASAAQELSPEERESHVERQRQGDETLSRGGRSSPFGVFDVFDTFFPNRNLRSMIDTMDRVFDDPILSRPRSGGRLSSFAQASRPPWDFVETGDAFRMRIDLPGLSKEEVKVYVEEGSLVIKGEHNEANKADENLWASRSRGSYSTRILLPDNVNTEQIKAELKNGVLSVSVPKVFEKPKKNLIDVQVE